MNNKRLLIQTIVPAVLIILVNLLFPINFTAFFLICALGLLASVYWNSYYTCWSLIVTAAVAVTLNYLRPSADVYNNAAHHVIALKGYESQGDITLVNAAKPRTAVFDGNDFNGYVKISNDGQAILLNEKLSSHPIFVFDQNAGSDGAYVLKNKGNLIEFNKSLSFSHGKEKVELTLVTAEDSVQYKIYFKTEEDSIRNSIAAFNKHIKEGYPLVDIIRSAGNCTAAEENLISPLKDVAIINSTISYSSTDVEHSSFYITMPSELENALSNSSYSIKADGKSVVFSPKENSFELGEKDKLFIGYGALKTRTLTFVPNNGNGVVMNYDMPIMYNFPVDSLGCCNKISAISSSSEDLLSNEIKEAFFFDMFHCKNNVNHFAGTISYQTAPSPVPLKVSILDSGREKGKKVIANIDDKTNHFQLTTKDNKARWNISIVNLREESPITESANIWIKDWTLLGIILIVSLFAFSTLFLFNSEGRLSAKSTAVFNIWCFFIPLLTLRLYLLWRIAVFPPVKDISKVEFLRYRMENALSQNAMVLTLLCIGLLLLLTLVLYAYHRYNKEFNLTFKQAKRAYFGLLGFTAIVLVSRLVLGNITIPVIVFFANEYLCIRYLSLPYRIGNAFLILGFLVLGDPGYAIMFALFECVYFIIQTIVYKKSEGSIGNQRNAAWKLALVLSVVVSALFLFLPNIVSSFYSSETLLGIKFPYYVFAIISIIALVTVCKILIPYYGVNKVRKIGMFGVVVAICVTVAAPSFLDDNKHVKYRTLIHTQDVGQIMMNEDVEKRDNQRLLEASQNQWFLQYHSNLGEDRIFDDGLMHVYPHFKKGVSWNTQISDVICSRYIIGELSMIVPLAIIIFAFVFFVFSLRQRNDSAQSKSIAYGVALLMLMQIVFVWMANTNRMIFFGQDFPFMSQNARATMILFVVLLFIMMMASSNREPEIEKEGRLSIEGFHYFNKRPFKIFCVFVVLVFGIVFFTGNNYSNLYETSEAKTFSAGEAINQAEKDFEKINEILATYPASKPLKPHGENLTSLFQKINNKIGLDDFVDKLEQDKQIGSFSASLYRAFRNNLQRDNRVDNIVHLQYIDASDSYRFAINNGFYSLRAPEMQKTLWSGNVYAYDDKNDVDHLLVPSSNSDKIDIYRVPRSWLSDEQEDCGIADVRYSSKECDKVLHSPQNDYNLSAGIFVINNEDCIESRIGSNIFLDQLSGRKEKLLAKNMIINGENKFFYPLGKKFFWIKDFSEMLASQSHGEKNVNCELTIDKDLMDEVSSELASLKKTCSVVALDGEGNVRLMAENNLRANYNLDPNDNEAIENFIEQSYLNPDYSEESKIFGNQNLIYMLPGPGSSLKPITYAAVTSQVGINVVNWPSLKLHAPDREYLSENGRYYQLLKYGPDYKYLPEAPFKSMSEDERGDGTWVDNDFYLYKSSNYYNALVSYLGNFDIGDLGKISELIEPATDAKAYPVFQLNGSSYTFKKSPSNRRQNCVLNTGLSMNFNMSVADDDSIRTDFVSSRWMNGAKAVNHPWVFPATSNAYMSELSQLQTEALRLKQYTLGASPLRITPLMMAEMYGRLFSMHPDYYACITKENKHFNKKWESPNGVNRNDMFQFYQQNLFKGMYHCTTIGTAAKHLNGVNRNNSSYYLYAKTGTLTLSNKIKDDRMLAVIITNQDVLTATSPESFRFYVVYFRFKQTGDMYSISKILNQIIASKSFTTYMQTSI